MIIIIFGNLGSGKSTLAIALQQQLRYEYHNIDDYRRDFSDGSTIGETLAKQNFIYNISGKESLIIELLGIGSLCASLYDKYQNNHIKKLVIVLDVPTNICLKRIDTRTWDIPFPTSFGSANKILENTNQRLIVEKSYLKWNSLPNCVIRVFKNTDRTELTHIINTVTDYVNENRR